MSLCAVLVTQLYPTLCDPMNCTCQSPLSMKFSKQEYWSGLPCPPPGNLPNPGFKPVSPMTPALQEDSLPLSHLGSPQVTLVAVLNSLTWVGKPVKASEIKWNVQRELLQSTASSESRSVVSDSLWPPGLYPSRLLCSWNSPGKNTGVVCHALLQGIFPTQGLNPDLPHCRQILHHLSHQGSPRILEWMAYHFSRASSRPRNWTGISCIAGGFFTSWATRKALMKGKGS